MRVSLVTLLVNQHVKRRGNANADVDESVTYWSQVHNTTSTSGNANADVDESVTLNS